MKTKTAIPEQKESKRKLFLPIFIAVILVMSTFGIVLSGYSGGESSQDGNSQDGNRVMINEREFVQTPQGTLSVDAGGTTVYLQSAPSELSSVTTGVSTQPLRAAKKIYLSHAPQYTTSGADCDIYNTFKPSVPVLLACYRDGPGCENLPLKDCADAQQGTIVIKFEQGDKNSVSLTDNCYTFIGDPIYITKIVDKLLLDSFGVDVAV